MSEEIGATWAELSTYDGWRVVKRTRPGVVLVIAKNLSQETAELIAAAPETAAERDRLKAENETLRKMLAGCHETIEAQGKEIAWYVGQREDAGRLKAENERLRDTLEFAAEAIGRQSPFWKDPILARVVIDIEKTLAEPKGGDGE